MTEYSGHRFSMLAAPLPYRTVPEGPQPVERPREFVYAARHPADEHAGLRAVFPVLLLAGVACAVLGSYGHLTVGLALLLVTALWAWRFQSRRTSGVIVRIENGMMLVYPWRGGKTAAAVALDDVLDVRLDTKTLHKPQRETRPGVFAPTGFTGSLEVDVARIALVAYRPAHRAHRGVHVPLGDGGADREDEDVPPVARLVAGGRASTREQRGVSRGL